MLRLDRPTASSRSSQPGAKLVHSLWARPEMTEDTMKMLTVSIAVCTANRADDLAVALDHLAHLHLPERIEVELIVVDNMPHDHTRRVVEAARTRMPFPLRILTEATKGSGAARNCALRYAQGDIIAWTDDDCIVDREWLARIIQHFQAKPSLDVLGGRIELFDQTHLPITIKTSTTHEVMGDETFPGAILLSCNMAFRRRVIERIGGFDIRFGAGARLRAGEDAEFILRAYRAGCHVAYTPDVLIYHNHKRTTERQALALKSNYHAADGAFLMKHAVQGDRGAARWLYWRFCHLVAAFAKKPLTMATTRERATFLVSFLQGCMLYLRYMHASSCTEDSKMCHRVPEDGIRP